MIKKIYCIKDNLKGQYDNIMLEVNDGLALRTIKNCVNDEKCGLLFTNTSDFSVYSLGSVDSDTGIIDSNVEFVINCIDLKEV